MELSISMLQFKEWLDKTVEDARDKLGLNSEQIAHVLFVKLRELEKEA